MRPLRKVIRRWRQWRLDERLAFRAQDTEGSVVACAPEEVLARQYVGTDCMRLDLFVRTLAVAEFAGTRTGGAALYAKYRDARPSEDKSVSAFAQLFEDLAVHGFDPRYPIEVARDASILDGAHRLACAMTLKTPRMPVRIMHLPRRFYTVTATWFREHGFSAEEIALLEREAEQYRQRLLDG